jgi:Domain of unknown function (DUF929)
LGLPASGLVLSLVIGLAFSPAAAGAKVRTDGSMPAPAQIVRLVTNVPAGALDQVGAGDLAGPSDFGIFTLKGSLEHNGKPELLSEDIAWCPHCAANSWGLAVALSRFGTLTHLRVLDTGTYYCKLVLDACALSPVRCYPHTRGLSFLDARYRSRYLSFTSVVFQDLKGHNLEKSTPAEDAAVRPFDTHGEVPAVDIGGTYGFLNSAFDPGSLAHKSWSQIATSLSHPHDAIARHIDGLANLFTAAVCKATHGRPTAVCQSSGVRSAGAAHLH